MAHARRVITQTLLYYGAFQLSVALHRSISPADILDIARVVDLSHGLRVILAWFFGLISISHLAPISFLTHWGLFDEPQSIIQLLGLPLFGLVCTPLVFEFADRFGVDLRLKRGYVNNWYNVVSIGVIASSVDAMGCKLITGCSYKLMLVDLGGNMAGMILGIGVLRLASGIIRNLTS